MCDVCESNEVERVCASATGPVSFSYCRSCLKEGYEPYGALISMNVTFDDMREDLKPLVKKNLNFHNKTVEEFNEDVKQARKEMYTV